MTYMNTVHEKAIPVQVAVGSEVMSSVYGEVVERIAERVKSVEMGNLVIFNFKEMPVARKAKIRHVGA